VSRLHQVPVGPQVEASVYQAQRQAPVLGDSLAAQLGEYRLQQELALLQAEQVV